MEGERLAWLQIKAMAFFTVVAATLQRGFDKGFTTELFWMSAIAAAILLICVSVAKAVIEHGGAGFSREAARLNLLRFMFLLLAVAVVSLLGWLGNRHLLNEPVAAVENSSSPPAASSNSVEPAGGPAQEPSKQPALPSKVSSRPAPREDRAPPDTVPGEGAGRVVPVDPGYLYAARRATIVGRFQVIGDEDYPAVALRAGEQGSVQISVQVAPDGSVASCSVTQSSGSAILDDASCRLWSSRARYDPARDSFGRAISDRHSQRIHWRLPFRPDPEPPVE